MDSYSSEEEQVEEIKRWLKENGVATLIAIVVVVAGFFGWQHYHKTSKASAEKASISYQQLLEVNQALNTKSNETQLATAHHLAKDLQDNYSDTSYAQFGALINARLYVNADDLVNAEKELRWVLDHSSEQTTLDVTELRLARVLDAQGKSDAANKLIAKKHDTAVQVGFDELKGDMLKAKGDAAGARAAYQKALDGAKASHTQASSLLPLKLQNLPAVKGE